MADQSWKLERQLGMQSAGIQLSMAILENLVSQGCVSPGVVLEAIGQTEKTLHDSLNEGQLDPSVFYKGARKETIASGLHEMRDRFSRRILNTNPPNLRTRIAARLRGLF